MPANILNNKKETEISWISKNALIKLREFGLFGCCVFFVNYSSVYLVPSGSFETETQPSVEGRGLETDALLVWPFPAGAADPLLVICMF